MSVGGRFYHRKISNEEGVTLINHGLFFSGSYVRFPLMQCEGLFVDKAFTTESAYKYYRLTCLPLSEVDVFTEVTPEIIYFRRSLHARYSLPPPVTVKWIGGLDYCDNYAIFSNRASWHACDFGSFREEFAHVNRLPVHKRLAWIDTMYPTMDQQLRCREKINAADAFKAAYRFIPFDDLVLLLWLSAGLGGQTLARVILYYLTSSYASRILKYLAPCFTGQLESTRKNLKDFHNYCRNIDYVDVPGCRHMCVDSVLYIHLLIGRVPERPGDLYADLSPRFEMRPPRELDVAVEDSSLYLLDRLLEKCVLDGKTYPLTSLENMYLVASNLTTGSSSTKHLRLMRNSLMSTYTKAEAFLLSRFGEIRDRLYRSGLRGKAISKLEPGARNRPLLPSDDSDWLRWTFLLAGVEAKIWRILTACPLSWDDADWAKYATLMRLGTSAGVVFGASDFDDYNQLHTNSVMCKIALRLGAHLATVSHDPAYLHVAKLVADGIEHSKLTIDGTEHSTKFGLWSGWRSTTFINSILNPVYNTIHAYRASIQPKAGVFMGDDSCNVFNSIEDAVQVLTTLDADGFYAQHQKQMVSLRRTEFLRLMWRDGLPAMGSLVRAISNGISGDLQSSPADVALSEQWLQGWLKRVSDRGGRFSSSFVSRLSRVVRAKIGYYTTVYLSRSEDAYGRAREFRSRDTKNSRKVSLTTFIHDKVTKFSLPLREVKREVYDSHFGTVVNRDNYLLYSKPEYVSTTISKYDGSWDLHVRYFDETKRVIQELFSRILGPVACSQTARRCLVERYSILELARIGNLAFHDRFLLLRLRHSELLKQVSLVDSVLPRYLY